MENDRFEKQGMRVAVAVAIAFIVDGLDLQVLAMSLPVLMKDLNVTLAQAGALGTYTLLGMGVGGICAGWLSDRIGRVRVTTLAVLTFSVFTAVTGLCQTYWQVALMRFITGFGLAAVYSIGSILAAEYVPTRIRNTVLGAIQACWSIGYILAAICASYILPTLGWRPLFILAIFPGIISLLLFRGITDPPSWFAARQAAREATGRKQNEYVKIWNDPQIRRIFLFWCITSTALQFSYYGANTWLPSYLRMDLGVDLKSMGWYMAATYVCMVLGKCVAGWLGDIFGRKAVWVFVSMVTAAALPLIVHLATPVNVAYLLLVFGLLYGAPYAVNATYMSESFPTAVRGTAVGTAYNVGRIGGTLSPLMIGLVASQYSVGYGIALLGISYAICAIVPGIFIREKMFDPKAVETEPRLPAMGLDSAPIRRQTTA